MLLKEIESFLEEDLGPKDYTEIALYTDCKAEITVREGGILAGLDEAKQIFEYFSVDYSTEFDDGDRINGGEIILRVKGLDANILRAERLVLNFLGQMSGVATLTRMFVDEVRKVSEHVKVAGTRKTTPGFRKYEKKAIAIGGGDPHRSGLYDAVILKDNHIKLMGQERAIKKAREQVSYTQKIEVEVESIDDAVRAAELGVDIIMFDNLSPAEVKECVQVLIERGLRAGVILEASGGINMENIKEFASTGVDALSTSMITQAARSLDFSLNLLK